MTSAMRRSAAAGSGAAVVEGAAGDAIGAGAFAALSAGLRSKKNPTAPAMTTAAAAHKSLLICYP
jgi:hypothetical protein